MKSKKIIVVQFDRVTHKITKKSIDEVKYLLSGMYKEEDVEKTLLSREQIYTPYFIYLLFNRVKF
jgi:hypothetical protein